MRKTILLSLVVLLTVTSASAGLGDSSSEAAESCKHINEWRSGADSGYYWIELNNNAMEVYCDMDYNGGGWRRMNVSESKKFVDTLGGGIDVIDDTNGHGYDGDRPYAYDRTRSGDERHYIHYNINTGVSFGEMAVENMAFTAQSNRIGGRTSETDHVGSFMGSWASGANAGNVVWGADNQSEAEDGFENGDTINCGGCTRTWSSSNGNKVYYNLDSPSNTVRIGMGEKGWQGEGWRWESGSIYIRSSKDYSRPRFELSINGPSSATPGYSPEYSTEITNTGSATGEVGLLELTKDGRTENSLDVGSLTPGESRMLSDFVSFGSEGDYQICGKAQEISKEKCITVTATESDGSTVWRRLVNFRLDLTGPDSGLGWDQDSSWQGMDGGDDYAPNQQDFKQGSSVVFTNVYWQNTFDSGTVTQDDLLEVHEPPMCGDDEREYLLEEMGESINSEKNTGRYACADTNNYCVYRRPSGYKIFDRGEKVNADEDGEDYGRFKGDEAVCAQRPGLSDSSDYNRFPSRPNDLTPQWYDQDYANQINNDGSGVIDVPDQDVCRTNTLFGRQGVRWIPMSEVANNPHAFTGGIDDSWNPRLEQMNHPYYIADPEGENWDGDENPLNVDVSGDPDAEGYVPVPTGVEDLYGNKVAAPTNIGYGFCGGDDASEYLIHQDSESRFISTDTSVRGLARSPDHCMLDNSRFNIDASNLDRENFDGSNLQDERMIYEEGESISFDSGGTTRSAACFSGKWWTDFPVVFLEDEKTVGLGSTGLTTFRIINPRDSSREFNLDLSISNDDLDSKVTFEDTGTNEMKVEIPGETSRTYDLKIRGTGAEEITSNNNVELQAQTTRGDLEGYDSIDIEIIDVLSSGTDTGATRDVPGIQLVQAIVLTLLGSVIFFFTN